MGADRSLPRATPRGRSGRAAAALGAAALEADLGRLGRALAERAGHVASRMTLLAAEAGRRLDSAGEQPAAGAAAEATVSVARWLAGGGQGPPADPARECARAFALLAQAGVAPLSEITECCLLWRDAVGEAVHEIAGTLSLDAHARARTLVLLRSCLNAALLRVSECFESAQRMAEQELSFAATHDRLTGLPSRGLLVGEVERMLREVAQTGGKACVLLLDLDEFQGVNDRLGYAAGDELLRQVARRLPGAAGDEAAVARLAGDEFAVALIPSSPQEAASAADRLLAAARGPYPVAGGEAPLPLSASVGFAAGGAGGAEELLRQAATALHHAKIRGRDRAVRFRPGMQERVRSIDLEMQVRAALAERQLRLVYQPVFGLGDAIVPTGLEALLRWEHPERGAVSPAEFIPDLERSGLIVDVGRFVLMEACEQCAAWHAAGLPVNVGVNVSARQLDDLRLIEDVRFALASSGLPPQALVVEVTETAAMQDVGLSSRVLRELKDEGVRVAIDDFGTGYSSLAHLQQLPIDTLKIDRSFVSRAAEGGAGEVLLRALAQLGDSLQLTTLAEGIETLGQLELLRAIGCQKGQGFLLSVPLAADVVSPFLQEKLSVGAVRSSG